MTNWQDRWKNNQIGWHKNDFNQRMIQYLPNLNLKRGDCIFVPLCGKSLDMVYLLNQGFKVVGVELSKVAIVDFFSENNIKYDTHKDGDFTIYQGENITIYQGDIFNLQTTNLAEINAIYDRAALVALNPQLRKDYTQLFNGIIKGCVVYLLLTLDYNQEKLNGPPFAVNENEVNSLFKNWTVKQLSSFNDIENEVKFKNNGLTYLNKESYILEKK